MIGHNVINLYETLWILLDQHLHEIQKVEEDMLDQGTELTINTGRLYVEGLRDEVKEMMSSLKGSVKEIHQLGLHKEAPEVTKTRNWSQTMRDWKKTNPSGSRQEWVRFATSLGCLKTIVSSIWVK